MKSATIVDFEFSIKQKIPYQLKVETAAFATSSGDSDSVSVRLVLPGLNFSQVNCTADLISSELTCIPYVPNEVIISQLKLF
ncbi:MULTISPECIES: hypothetical protein [unclassified Paenibacillus]|uniref:hypothetical protein n=1 Tax=unclassified Paenibacillus TaxID=185978 RepID=UPI003834BE97